MDYPEDGAGSIVPATPRASQLSQSQSHENDVGIETENETRSETPPERAVLDPYHSHSPHQREYDPESYYESEESHTHHPQHPMYTLGPPIERPPDEYGSDGGSPDSRARNREVGIVSPTPVHGNGRDTIHRILDQYGRESVVSTGTRDSEYEVPPVPPPHDYASPTTTSMSVAGQSEGKVHPGSRERGESRPIQENESGVLEQPLSEEEGSGFEPKHPGSGGEGSPLLPPPPMFDLTPGREPSPARYKHGEPLHFVDESPEEEEIETF